MLCEEPPVSVSIVVLSVFLKGCAHVFVGQHTELKGSVLGSGC